LSDEPRIPLVFRELPPDAMRARAEAFLERMGTRRSVRDFSDRPIPDGVLEAALVAAGTAPSGANRQPWHFVVVRDPAVKRRLREAAEAEERAFYERRASDEWLDALAPLGTDASKPFLETAPALVAVFAQKFSEGPAGERRKNYYTAESVGLATGFVIAALHLAGLATLTHTPSPMRFLNEILGRPADERPFVLLVVGYPAEGATVPDITRKPFDRFVTQLDGADAPPDTSGADRTGNA
jgi:iodotyrosine deiodinase